ncbi:hypothetical protein GH714_036077 [Hevea brasiliensis]|uniref:Xylanase inhibitor N-terminal domain-containing protein n=1 Tax=Hevea brasiliensis TaxID=3981 RepID=A0A6A6L8Y3_HEVBR|nr:hypothetical protein GH714_036077 [Hevea brasiliensis]
MVLDTGSELSWLHCKKAQGLNSIFNPATSTTYAEVLCSSPTCRTEPVTLTYPFPVTLRSTVMSSSPTPTLPPLKALSRLKHSVSVPPIGQPQFSGAWTRVSVQIRGRRQDNRANGHEPWVIIIRETNGQDIWMEFDLEKSRIGLAEVRCDIAGQKLGLHK